MEGTPPPPVTPPQFVPIKQIRFAAIREAWDYLTSDVWGWIACMLILMAIFGIPIFIISLGLSFTIFGSGGSLSNAGPSMSQLQLYQEIWMVFAIPIIIFSMLLVVGLQKRALCQVRGSIADVSTIFRLNGAGLQVIWFGFIGAGLAVLGRLVQGTNPYDGSYSFDISTRQIIALLASVIVGTCFQVLFGLAPLLCVDRKMKIGEALKTSATTFAPHFLRYVGLYLLASVCSCLGIFACCFGIIFTYGINVIVPAIVYQDFFGPSATG